MPRPPWNLLRGNSRAENIGPHSVVEPPGLGADEGSLGSGLSWGGAAVVPVGERFALDMDVSTVRTRRTFSADEFEPRRTFLAPSLVGRWGTDRTYAFAGAGIGMERSSSRSRSSNLLPGVRPPGAREVSPGVFEFRSSDTGASLVIRAGIVQQVWRKTVARFDQLWSQRHVLPNVGVRFGLGFRF